MNIPILDPGKPVTEEQDLAARYREILFGYILASTENRLRELLGTVPSQADQKAHILRMHTFTGAVQSFWVFGEHESAEDCARHAIPKQCEDGPTIYLDVEPLIQFVPHGFDQEGRWRDYAVMEIRR